MQKKLNYGSLFQGWEIAVAKNVVNDFLKKNKLRGIDFEDLLQESLLYWHRNKEKYKTDKRATVQTFMGKILRRKLRDIRVEQIADKRKINHLSRSLDEAIDISSDHSEATLKDTIEDFQTSHTRDNYFLNKDLTSIIKTLPPDQQKICQLLLNDYPIKEISSILNKPRSTIYGEIKRMGEAFSKEGLKEY
ncbi:RNA polymerase sigma factor [Candidatus Auribacterota bacterium]